jgi:hypothetical protein
MPAMKKALLALGALAILGGGGYYFFVMAPKRELEASKREHREELERSLAPAAAMLKAPVGKTPCETSYNGYRAFEDTARAQSQAAPWGQMPDQATFMQRCSSLTEQEQKCLDHTYNRANHATCDPIVQNVISRNVLFDKTK